MFFDLFKSTGELFAKKWKKTIAKINELENLYSSLSKEEIGLRMHHLKQRITIEEENLDNVIADVFAIVREVSKRTKSLRPFDVQLLGAIALHKGKIAEMKTGEGKTLVASLSAVLNSLNGNGVYVVTVNEYLTKRDWEYCKPIYDFLNLSSAFVTSEKYSGKSRKESYGADIIYCHQSSLVFDYLKHNMRIDDNGSIFPHRKMIDGTMGNRLAYAIIDEIDSALIDNSSPLVISDHFGSSNEAYIKIKPLISSLLESDYVINHKSKKIVLTDIGAQKVEEWLSFHGFIEGSLYSKKNLDVYHVVVNLLRAYKLLKENRDYIIKGDEIILIDEVSGRLSFGKRLSDGHQALEAKHNLPVRDSTVTKASITYPNFFRLFEKLSGMTGTAMSDRDEFSDNFNIEIVTIPTNVPVIRIDEKYLRLYRYKNDMFQDVAKLVKETNTTGQPILIVTTSVDDSELLSETLAGLNINVNHQLLNAKNHEQEARIIAQAGKPFAVTISTNMAGRGVDILLGGNEEEEIKYMQEQYLFDPQKLKEQIREKYLKDREFVKSVGGLFVIVVGAPDSEKSVLQFKGRCARQGDPGRSMTFCSLEDHNLQSLLLDDINKWLLENHYTDFSQNRKFSTGSSTDQIVKYVQDALLFFYFEVRKNLLKYDNVINEQRQVVFKFRDWLISLHGSAGEHVLNKVVKEFIYDIKNMTHTKRNKKLKELNLTDENWEKTILDERIKLIDEIQTQENWQKNLEAQILSLFDECWYYHIVQLENLKRTVHVTSYEQKEPHLEYRRMAHEMFIKMLRAFRGKVLSFILKKDWKEDQVSSNDLFNQQDFESLISSLMSDNNKNFNFEDLVSKMQQVIGNEEKK